MSVTVNDNHHPKNSKTKIAFIVFLFLLSLFTFVTQTELTSQAYSLGFNEPIILLLVTHGSWWILWPIQVLIVSLIRVVNKLKNKDKNHYQPLDSSSGLLQQPANVDYWDYSKKSVVKQFHNIYHTSIIVYEYIVNGDERTSGINELIEQHPHISSTSSISACVSTFLHTPSVKFILVKSFVLVTLLTVAGLTWYAAMALTYASDVTAIYNCSAFTAYIFAIPLLNESFSWLKASSVIIAVSGVFIVAYSGSSEDAHLDYPYRFWGNLAILVGAVIYGLYEVFYKKYLCIPPHLAKLITPRRQLSFATFVMSLLGLYTVLILAVGCTIVHVTGIHKFVIFDYPDAGLIWAYIVGCIISNLAFSAAFLCLISLTNPVLSSVSSLLTIFLIGVVEWVLFDNVLSLQQLIGDVLVVIGFVLLTVASWQEISEGEDNDEVETISTYSFAISTINDS